MLAHTQFGAIMVYRPDTEREAPLARTNIDIDSRLIKKAMELTGARSKREAVDIALRRLVEKGTVYEAIRTMRGKLAWTGDIESWRAPRR